MAASTKELIEKLKTSRSEDDRKRCIPLLQEYLQGQPQDAVAWYDLACCYDFCGDEKKAEPCYQKTYELGWQQLPAAEQAGFFVGFGSTLRNNLDFAKSEKILREGILQFPEQAALKVFLSFTLHTEGRFEEASRMLFASTLQMPEQAFGGYEKAIKWYVDHLNTHPLTAPETLYEVGGVKIRAARPHDAAELANVHLNSWREAYKGQIDQAFLDNMPFTFKRRKKNWEETLATNIDSVFVAESEQGLVGFVLAQLPSRDEDMKDYGEIGAIYLLEKFKGKKIGLHLLQASFAAMKRQGFTKAYCWMLKGNATGKFYESTGARMTDREKAEPLAGTNGADVMYIWEHI